MNTARARAALLLLLAPAAVWAQESTRPAHRPADEAELLARIQELGPRVEEALVEAEAAVERYKAARARRIASVDTFSVGPLTIVAPPGEVEEGRLMYQRVWDEEYAPFVDRSPTFAEVNFTYQFQVDLQRIHMEGRHFRAEATTWRGPGRIQNLIRESIGRALQEDLRNTQIYGWVREAVRDPGEAWAWVYRRAATRPAKVLRDCLEGVEGACWSALAVDRPQDAITSWYTSEERRLLVETNGRFRGREFRAARDACVEQGDQARCDALLQELADRWGGRYYMDAFSPLGWQSRATLLWTALTMGGEGAWGRLLEDPEMSVGDALRYAAGHSTEEIEAEWRRRLLEHRPQTQAGLARTKWTALFWILLIGALAMRSTRWRLG